VVVTGMAINTPLADTLDGFLAALLAGRSAITRWQPFDSPLACAAVGGDLSGYDVAGAVASLDSDFSTDRLRPLQRMLPRLAWPTQLSVLLALNAVRDAGLTDADLGQMAVLVAGHNLNSYQRSKADHQLSEEPAFVDPFFSISSLDTDHATTISEILGTHGPAYTIGGACASGNMALRTALDEARFHGAPHVLVVGAIDEHSPIALHALSLMGAITSERFSDVPERASRPFDSERDGFVPAHGGAALVLEPRRLANRRGARVYAEVVGVESGSDGCRLPHPSAEGQARLMQQLLERCHVAPDEVDYVSAHATSTRVGDLTEIRSIARAFGAHAARLKINATKSMLGHTLWSAPLVETVAAVLQMNAGVLHPTINVDRLDPEIELDVCANRMTPLNVRLLMKNSFGFGGINSISLLRRCAPDGAPA
jgi:3-oxoacyl-(acyl-carrier-protein) synthase